MLRPYQTACRLLLVCFLLMNGIAWAKDSHQITAQTTTHDIAWQPWSEAVFEQAKRENKLVILDLEAVWCHWCHVMDEKTYHDPEVLKLIQQHFLAIRVDQDANPDISIRYEDYGWPATVIFAPDGNEIAKRRGYIAPENMRKILQAMIADPTPGPSITPQAALMVSSATQLSTAQSDKITADINRGYDSKLGGWGDVHKYILAQNVEYAMIKAKQGDKAFEKKARETLDKALALIDPAWGGMYQYSDRGRWDSPHFEKIMSIQTDDLRLYALAYKQFNEPRYLKAARDIERYLVNFLTSPEGAFYTSQDADASDKIDGHAFYPLDDKSRRALGVMPRIDKHRYARENGWAIRSLAVLYDATGDKKVLDRAIKAANWVEANRRLADGGFSHDAKDRAGPYLGDSLAMAQAYMALYASTGDGVWLAKSRSSSQFINQHFKVGTGFAVASNSSKKLRGQPTLQMEENVSIARLANQLARHTGDAQYKTMAHHAMRYLIALANQDKNLYLAGTLIANDELAAKSAQP